ncbi:MAG: complex I NDUFA9 subunit family protein [Thermoanaerobaculum sp.]|nr:complex I NDUFA9 subunit family protein [Thermoanaerobaculum sp.]MDW7968197.1 complex I NDUFA9 subunit family protein [Thermoanaerobaculum sp.]
MEREKKPRRPRKKPTEQGLFPETPKKVLVTGASGFVGTRIVAELLQRGFQVVALARRLSQSSSEPGVIRVAADVTLSGWERWVEGCSAVIHLVGIIREDPRQGITFHGAHVEATARVVEVCKKFGIFRLVHMSAVGADPQSPIPYHRTKGQAEELVRASGLAWTIFRPSVIFGPGDGFTTTLTGVIRRAPLVPVFGDGSYPLQPVAVEEVAEAFVASLENPQAVEQIVELGGPEVLSYRQVLQRIASSLGKKRLFVPIPLPLVRPAVKIAAWLLSNPPITPDELAMLLAGSTADIRVAQKLFDLPRKNFRGVSWSEAWQQPRQASG